MAFWNMAAHTLVRVKSSRIVYSEDDRAQKNSFVNVMLQIEVRVMAAV